MADDVQGSSSLCPAEERCDSRLEEDYHSIKDDIPLVSVYTTRNVTVKGMLIPDDLLIDAIRETQDTLRATKTPNQAVVDEVVSRRRNENMIAGEQVHSDPISQGGGKKDDKKDDDDDDDDDDHTDHASIRTQLTGSSEIRIEKMPTLIPSPPRSPKKDLSSDKAIA
ncbi:hypothetical protein Tco_1061423 [Tanacetum coccineum]